MGWREEARRGTRILPGTRREPTRARGGGIRGTRKGGQGEPGEHPERESRRGKLGGGTRGGDPGRTRGRRTNGGTPFLN